MPTVVDLGNYVVGSKPTVALRAYDADKAEKPPSTVYFLGLDPGRVLSGTVTSGVGSKTSFLIANTEADNFWDKVALKISQADGSFVTECASFDGGAVTGIITLQPAPWAVASNATWWFLGYPLLTWQSGAVSTAKGSIQVLPSGSNEYTAYAGPRRLLTEWNYTNDIHRVIGVHDIKPGL